MLRFFRQIRQRRLTDNKFSKYLLYAIGEILLVVIGIMIALQIDNWKEQQEQQRTVQRYLAAIIEDLNKDLEQFRRRGDQAVFRFYSSQQLLKMVGEAPVKLRPNEHVRPLSTHNSVWDQQLPDEPDSLFLALGFLWSIRGTPPVISLSTITEMTGTGVFSFITNKPLKDSINDYYNELNWRFGEELSNERREIIRDWKNSLLQSGVLAQDISSVEDPLGLLRNNTERIGLLRAIVRAAWFEAVSLDSVGLKAESLIKIIETELEK